MICFIFIIYNILIENTKCIFSPVNFITDFPCLEFGSVYFYFIKKLKLSSQQYRVESDCLENSGIQQKKETKSDSKKEHHDIQS
jgi:hypothetical protein